MSWRWSAVGALAALAALTLFTGVMSATAAAAATTTTTTALPHNISHVYLNTLRNTGVLKQNLICSSVCSIPDCVCVACTQNECVFEDPTCPNNCNCNCQSW